MVDRHMFMDISEILETPYIWIYQGYGHGR